MNESLYTIGKTAELCNLSEAQLRNYDRMGLLSPEARGNNNYRYYTQTQLEKILIIKELKSFGIPLRTIVDLLKKQNMDRIRHFLEEAMIQQRSEIHRMLKRYDALIDRVLMINQAGITRGCSEQFVENGNQGFSVVAIAERPIISLRKKSKCYKTQHYTERYLELQNLIEEKNIKTGRSWFIIYHDPYECIFDWGEEAIGDMEFFFNVEQGGLDGSSRMFGGFQAACATYIGAYTDDRHKKTYDRLASWARSLGHKVSGISYQELLLGRNITQNESEYVTKIYLPLDITAV